MENIMEKLAKDTINEIQNTEVKKIVIENEITPEQRAIMESIKKIKNPFKMLTVQDIMKDLNICETVAYRTFKRWIVNTFLYNFYKDIFLYSTGVK